MKSRAFLHVLIISTLILTATAAAKPLVAFTPTQGGIDVLVDGKVLDIRPGDAAAGPVTIDCGGRCNMTAGRCSGESACARAGYGRLARRIGRGHVCGLDEPVLHAGHGCSDSLDDGAWTIVMGDGPG